MNWRCLGALFFGSFCIETHVDDRVKYCANTESIQEKCECCTSVSALMKVAF